MNRLQIDIEYLLFAWQDESPDTAYYLDSETGSVLLVQQDLEDVDELKDEIELQPSRYLYVPKADPSEVWLDLSDFIFTVPDEQLKSLLSVAYESPNPLAACKSVLSKHPDETKRWETFRKDAVRERVRRWLAANNIESKD